ncbi:MAG: hydantoinase/oxoprolinase family protein [bacterium]|nr:hydantoinase/oxoprolinase family protein [bacterium]
MTYIVGIDVGGTFTDLVLLDETNGTVSTAKVPSTPADQSQGLLHGLATLEVPLQALQIIVHGTTVATNAVLERRGAVCGLLTTAGFRDILELRRRDRPDTYGLKGQFEPLIPRHLRLEITERTDYQGNILHAVDQQEVERQARVLLAEGVEAVVVSYLHAYANPTNEQRTREALERVWPNPYIVLGSEVLPEFREFERTSTAAASAYVQPLIDRYLRSLSEQLQAKGYQRDILLIQSNGGVMSLEVSRRFSVNTILSGPAAGVIAAKAIAEHAGYRNVITCDMGGTSLDIALVAAGQPSTTSEIELGYGIPVRVPMLDITTVGAGGGSIAWIDRGGLLQIGPQSAGADPGPACYGRGGQLPTVTDANLLLGCINPTAPLGSDDDWRLDASQAEQAVQTHIGDSLNLSTLDAARAIVEVANAKMAGSIRMISVERGHDPRDFVLVAFGGGGPLHASALLRELGLSKVIVPYYPGLTSALGCIMADARHDFLQTINSRVEDLDMSVLHGLFQQQRQEGEALLQEEGIRIERVEALFQADMAYDGQIHEVRTPLPCATLSREALITAFETSYHAQYGDTLGNRPIKINTLRTTVIGIRPTPPLTPPTTAQTDSVEAVPSGARSVYLRTGMVTCPVYQRRRLPIGCTFVGPAIVEQYDTTTFVEPEMTVQVDAYSNLIIQEV